MPVCKQNPDGTWSPAKPLRGSWWMPIEMWFRRRQWARNAREEADRA